MYTIKYARRLTRATNEAVDLVFFFLLEARAIARSSASGARDRSSKTRRRSLDSSQTAELYLSEREVPSLEISRISHEAARAILA